MQLAISTPPLVPASAATPPAAPTAPAAGAPAAPPKADAAGAGKPAPAGAGGKEQAPDLAKIVGMPVADAVAAATDHLTKLPTMTVGGGTKEGAAAAAKAAAMLQDASMLVQVVHRNALKSEISPELEMNLMMIASGMAAASSQVAMAQASSKPIALKGLLEKPAKQAIDVLATVVDHVGRTETQAATPSVVGYL